MGLLQITGFTDNPRGVKIRYKLILPQSADLSARLAQVIHVIGLSPWLLRPQ
jgi:hypothetical protein